MPQYELVTLAANDNWNLLQSFWYAVYVEEMRKQPGGMDRQAKLLNDELDNRGFVHCLMIDGQLAATIRRCRIAEFYGDGDMRRLFHLESLSRRIPLERVSYSSKLVIAPQFRSGTVMNRIVSYAYDEARRRQIPLDLLCCAPRLVNLYRRLGFHPISGSTHREGVGLLVPMVLVIDDLDYLRQVRSPFSRSAAPLPLEAVGRTVFDGVFGSCLVSPDSEDDCDLSLDELVAATQRRSAQLDHRETAVSLVDQEQLRECGKSIRVRAGQTIYSPGEPANLVYVILSGTVEVTLMEARPPRTVFVLGPGQVFGERSFYQEGADQEWFVASSDCTILAIDADEIYQPQIKSLPGQVMLLLLRAMTQRLRILELDFEHGRGAVEHGS